MNIIQKAKFLIEEKGNYKKAYKLLKPLIEKNDPNALFLFSSFSLESESIDEFEKRHLKLVAEAAKKGLPEAQYTLGVMYLSGWEGLARDFNKSSALFKKAAEGGHSLAKLSYGLDLYYGDNGMEQNKELGLAFIEDAADNEVEGAKDFLIKLKQEVSK